MAKIKSKGLDYFPLSTQYVNDRLVRRLMKQEGDRALAVLIHLLSMVYAGEGYYLRLDDVCCDDLADRLYQTTPDEVRRVASCAVELGLFDKQLYETYGVLTSAEIQQQFLFCTKRRRSARLICPEYNLIDTPETDEADASTDETETGNETVRPADDPRETMPEAVADDGEAMDGATLNCAKTPVCVTQNAKNAHLTAQIATKQSIAKQRKEKKTTPYPRL